ncbi:MAG: hypothetical protein J6D25_05920 [Eggerthellaceae bacterium]|nr:hypothetical protein [Eggerthellaceae bacterium]
MMHADPGRINLDCGIAYARIASWLEDELALPRADGGWVYSCDQDSCSISLEPLESRTLGKIDLERTRLVAEGDPHALESFDKLFTLRFISAGG